MSQTEAKLGKSKKPKYPTPPKPTAWAKQSGSLLLFFFFWQIAFKIINSVKQSDWVLVFSLFFGNTLPYSSTHSVCLKHPGYNKNQTKSLSHIYQQQNNLLFGFGTSQQLFLLDNQPFVFLVSFLIVLFQGLIFRIFIKWIAEVKEFREKLYRLDDNCPQKCYSITSQKQETYGIPSIKTLPQQQLAIPVIQAMILLSF